MVLSALQVLVVDVTVQVGARAEAFAAAFVRTLVRPFVVSPMVAVVESCQPSGVRRCYAELLFRAVS